MTDFERVQFSSSWFNELLPLKSIKRRIQAISSFFVSVVEEANLTRRLADVRREQSAKKLKATLHLMRGKCKKDRVKCFRNRDVTVGAYFAKLVLMNKLLFPQYFCILLSQH